MIPYIHSPGAGADLVVLVTPVEVLRFWAEEVAVGQKVLRPPVSDRGHTCDETSYAFIFFTTSGEGGDGTQGVGRAPVGRVPPRPPGLRWTRSRKVFVPRPPRSVDREGGRRVVPRLVAPTTTLSVDTHAGRGAPAGKPSLRPPPAGCASSTDGTGEPSCTSTASSPGPRHPSPPPDPYRRGVRVRSSGLVRDRSRPRDRDWGWGPTRCVTVSGSRRTTERAGWVGDTELGVVGGDSERPYSCGS